MLKDNQTATTRRNRRLFYMRTTYLGLLWLLLLSLYVLLLGILECVRPPAFFFAETKELTANITTSNNVTKVEHLDDTQSKASSTNTNTNTNNNNNNNNNNTTNRSITPDQRRMFYSQLRPDRSGAIILDMLMAHAYAYTNALQYGGACKKSDDPRNMFDVVELIHGLGLQEDIALACPLEESKAPIVDRRFYATEGTAVFTDAWLSYIQAKVVYPDEPETVKSRSEHSRRRAVVHIRRGDVQPCHDPEQRYLPNAYYQRAILDHVPSDHQVTIHSESQSFEPWDDFTRNMPRNDWPPFQWEFDAPVISAWRDMMTANVLIMSKSSFSMIPALLNRNGKIIYTHFGYEPLAHWYEARIIYQTDLDKLLHQLCHDGNRTDEYERANQRYGH